MKLVKVSFKSNVLEVEPESQSIVVKDVCVNLGIDFKSQLNKLKSDPTYQSKLIKVQTAGGMQEVFTIPLSKLNGWLFSINPNKVKPEVKQKLIEYKNECFEVLYQHFNNVNAIPKNDEVKKLQEIILQQNRLIAEQTPSDELAKLKSANIQLQQALINFSDRYYKIVLKAESVEKAVKKELLMMTNTFQTLPNLEHNGKNLNTDTIAKLSYW